MPAIPVVQSEDLSNSSINNPAISERLKQRLKFRLDFDDFKI